jgi:GntR family transcriptional regulator of vanillate catabolism
MSIPPLAKSSISSSVVGQAAPLHIQVYDHLWQALMAGELPAGTRLKDGSWAEKLGVSRTPVREAFRKLVQDGVLDPLDSVGFCVHAFTPEEITGLYDCRAALEALVAEEAATHRSDELLNELNANLADAERAIGLGDVEALQRLNGEFHAILLKVSRNRHLCRLVEQTERSVRMARQQVLQRATSDAVRREDYLRGLQAVQDHHRALVAAIAAGDPAKASTTMRDHLLCTAHDMTLMLAVNVACAA